MSDAVVSFDARASVAPDVLVSELAGESVLLNLKSECYFGLDSVGTQMWTTLIKADSIQVAFDELLAHYDVPADQLRSDLLELIRKLTDQGLLEIRDA
jgi:hypothetical protein